MRTSAELCRDLRKLSGQIDPCLVGGRDAVLLYEAADMIEALSSTSPDRRVRELALEQAAERARSKIIWILKGHHGRGNVADHVAEAILALKSIPNTVSEVTDNEG